MWNYAAVAPSAGERELTILLASPLPQAGDDSTTGLLVNGETQNQLANQVQVYAHALVTKCQPIEQEWRAYLEYCAEDLFETTGIDTYQDTLDGPEELRLMLTVAMEDYLAVNQRLVHLGKQVYPGAVNDDDNDYLIAMCVD